MPSSAVVNDLTATLRGGGSALRDQMVFFVIKKPDSTFETQVQTTDYLGRVRLGALSQPTPTGSVVTAYFGGSATLPNGTTVTLDNSFYQAPSASTTLTGFSFAGFLSPVSNTTSNTVKAGSAVPIKFSLGLNAGLGIFAGGYPLVTPTGCPSSPSTTTLTTVTANASGLQYDATSNQYTYVWKTPSGLTGCRQLVVKLADGSTHTALFTFK
jgi:hypothetical protein